MKIQCKYDALIDVAILKPHPKNRNKHPKEQIERLAKILEYQGFRYPIKVSKQSGFVTSGHGRIAAAKINGWKQVPVNYQDYNDETQEYADLTADNSIASWAELDLSFINTDIGDLGPDFDIDLLGIKDFVIEPADKFQGDEDDVPTIPKVPTTNIGDMYMLDSHRLLCGDSTNKANVETLMSGKSIDMVFTDPPYNIDFGYDTYDDKKSYEDYRQFCISWFRNIQSIPKIIITPGGMNLNMWLKDNDPCHVGVWLKDNAASGCPISHLSKWEPILFMGKFERNRDTDIFKHYVHSGFLRDTDTGNHPCPKPVDFIKDIIENYSTKGNLIYDCFLGSGTTLIASEKTGRTCYGMELDPGYCDVIVARWEKFTGKKATLISQKA